MCCKSLQIIVNHCKSLQINNCSVCILFTVQICMQVLHCCFELDLLVHHGCYKGLAVLQQRVLQPVTCILRWHSHPVLHVGLFHKDGVHGVFQCLCNKHNAKGWGGRGGGKGWRGNGEAACKSNTNPYKSDNIYVTNPIKCNTSQYNKSNTNQYKSIKIPYKSNTQAIQKQ